MEASRVKQYLLAEGCAENTFAVGSRGPASDAFCLCHDGRSWKVFYTERGCDSSPIFTSNSEEEACAFFVKHMLSQEHWHLVGSYLNEADAEALAQRVALAGARPIRNDIPHFSRMNDPRYRVFVKGRDIFAVRKALETIPVKSA
jgi:hypothetical protein